jgi:hypothetical protein
MSSLGAAALIVSALAMDEFAHRDKRMRSTFGQGIVIHKEGEPGSRMESTREHHKQIKRNKRKRKNKKGY